MRTKILLTAVAALAVGMVSSNAQVLSANVVGYVNLNLVTNTAGNFNLVANQLDADGNATNNTVFTVFGTSLPTPTSVYAWDPNAASFVQAIWSHSFSGNHWSGNTNAVNAALNPGGAVFVAPPSPTTVTTVGTVMQGTNMNITLTPGLQVAISDPVPLAGLLQTDLNYQPNQGNTANKDYVYLWNPASQIFNQYYFSHSFSGWAWHPSEPTVNVGQGFFLLPAATTNWNVSFKVQ